jgi:hypothetical protein
LVFINKCPRYLKEETEDCKTHSGISHWLQHRLGKNTRFQKKKSIPSFLFTCKMNSNFYPEFDAGWITNTKHSGKAKKLT